MAHAFRLPYPPALLLTVMSVSVLLLVAYEIEPGMVRMPMLASFAVMMVLIAFTSVELSIYLIIATTLLSPEIAVGSTSDDPNARGVTIRLDDVLLVLACLTWLFRMAITKELNIVRRTPINKPILLYWGATVLATIFGFYQGYVSSKYGFFFVAKYLEYFILFYVIVNDVHDNQTLHRYIIVLMITCLAASLYGISEIGSVDRVSAPFEGPEGEPNTFGGYLMLMFSVSLGMFFEDDAKYKQRWLIMLGLTVLPLVFTQSRSSYLAFAVMILCFVYCSAKRNILIIALLAGFVILPFIVPQEMVDRIMFTFHQGMQAGQIKLAQGVHLDTSTSDRLLQWYKALMVYFPSHPLLGRGVTGAGFMDAQYARILSESGLIGLAAFLWLLYRIGMIFNRGRKELRDGRLRGIALGGLCGFMGLLVHALGSNSFIIVRIMEPLMILLGLVMAALLIQRQGMDRSDADMEVSGP